jgi:type I restriction enzyme R subunit
MESRTRPCRSWSGSSRRYETSSNGFDYGGFVEGNESSQLHAITAGADYVFEQNDGKRRFMTLVAGLSKAFALSVPREETEAIRDHLGYFQAVRAAIRKRLADDGPPPPPDSRAAVRQVISGAIVSDGVIDLFRAAGLTEPNVGILSEDFLERLAALPHKNLALETLRKLLNDQIRTRERVNLVQSRSFRESLEKTLTRYTNRAVTTAQVVEELLGLARTIREAVRQGQAVRTERSRGRVLRRPRRQRFGSRRHAGRYS